MTKVQVLLRRIFSVVFCMTFCLLSYLCLTQGSHIIRLRPISILKVFTAAGLGSVLFLLIGQWIGQKLAGHQIAKWAKRFGVIAFFLLFLTLQLVFARSFYPTDYVGTWDFTNIAYITKNVVNAERAGYPVGPYLEQCGVQYFQIYPNNIPYFLLLHTAFRLFGWLVADMHTIGIGLNIVMIDLTLVLGFFVVKKLTQRYMAGLLYVSLCVLTLPLLSYTAVYYTDTLTLPFPIGAYLLWLYAKERFTQGKTRQAMAFCAGTAVVAALGMMLKISAGFILIAIAIDALVTLSGRRLLQACAMLACMFVLVYFPLGTLCRSSDLLLPENPEMHIPKLHWVMMGMNGNGGYCNDDYQMTLSVPAEQRDAFVKQEILRRGKAYGLSGMIEHLREKLTFTWADGTYYSAIKLNWDQRSASSLDQFFDYRGAKFEYVAIICQGMLLLNLVCAVITGMRLLQKNSSALPLLPCAIAVFGLFLFLCLWETRSRYLLNYVPIFLVMTVHSFASFSAVLQEKAKKICLR